MHAPPHLAWRLCDRRAISSPQPKQGLHAACGVRHAWAAKSFPLRRAKCMPPAWPHLHLHVLQARAERQQRRQRAHVDAGAVHESDARQARQLADGEDEAHVCEARAAHQVQPRQVAVGVRKHAPAVVRDGVRALQTERVQACGRAWAVRGMMGVGCVYVSAYA